ncbi:cupin domain-containing protein [Mycolicibacterium austroafricanum]|uniref:cupin domain-containing protein n=1 Tax=Mycolicibacterium austroafricanum TaxID=39687 RepID=UPI001CA33E3A|nr:cupin domain-containing protein [Mycolicibacterium austroafricanum]QZT60698.1 cupin domain-containing protein [Mycolicibacterium austroafricanum]
MKHVVTFAVAVIAATFAAATAGATPPVGDVERTELGQGTTSAPVVIVSVGQPTTLYVQELELSGPAGSGWHTHPGPEHTVITEGTVYVQSAPDCVPVAYPAGRAVFIPAGVPHSVRNEGPGDAHAVVTYTLPADRAVRDDAPAACP